MARPDPNEIIDVQDDAATTDGIHQIPNTVERVVTYADGRVEVYHYDDRNPPQGGEPWGRLVGRHIDKAQAQLYKEEVSAADKAEKEANARPNATLPSGAAPGRLDTPAIILSKIAQAKSAGVDQADIDTIFSAWDQTTGKLASSGAGGGSGSGGGRPPSASTLATAAKTEALLPGELEQQGLTAEKTRLEIQRAQQALLPKQQQVIQDGFDTINAIQKQLAEGNVTQADADRWVSSVHAYVDSAMRGTTPYDEWKEQEQIKTQRAQTAASILNQRVQSGDALASSLFGKTTDVLTANGGLLHGFSGFDPFQAARDETNYYGGGEKVGAVAQALLGQIAPDNAGGVHPAIADYNNGAGGISIPGMEPGGGDETAAPDMQAIEEYNQQQDQGVAA